ncbi:superoxide dismutase [Cu-Zn]-like isoform X2 [Prorops nasuta]|uniref:superoxide dismutase [Cu-Zn]-like isoform X2 n=1 Tax=Prorops nasuta TaxID=863751 RepID=UPI0034CDC9E7
MNRILLLLVPLFVAVTADDLIAVVRLTPDKNPPVKDVSGELKLVQSVPNGPVKITGTIKGLTQGKHGLHVHETGDLSEGCKSLGGHFNPENKTHGAPTDVVRHVGDLGNVEADASGVAKVDITDTVISLTGANNVLGRSFVIHSGEDDLGKGNSSLSLTTGNAGDRWACGIIGVSKK